MTASKSFGYIIALLIGIGLIIFFASAYTTPEISTSIESDYSLGLGASPEAGYEYEETKALVQLVMDAAASIEEQGEETFVQFNKKGSKWFRDDTYIVVFDMNLERKVYPPHQEKIGENIKDIKDAVGKPIGKMIMGAISEQKQGWTHYLWRKPDQWRPTWLSSFLMKAAAPSGQEYIVGSGIYNMRMERKLVFDLVNEAADLIEKKGEEAFPVLRDITSNFIFGNTYVFVDSETGIELVNPAFPKVEGQNIMDVKDITGKFPVREYISTAMAGGSGWSAYMWPKPKTTEPAKKLTYVKKVVKDKKTYIVGCGIYPD